MFFKLMWNAFLPIYVKSSIHYTPFSSQDAVWEFNTEHTSDHMRLTKIVHSQR